MQPISSTFHGVLDYLMGILLLAGPYLFELGPGAGSVTFVAFGGFLLFYSVLTQYPLGFVRLVPFKVHLGLDVLSGLALVASPWLFGFSDSVFVPHLVLGLVEIVAALLTSANGKPSNRLL